MAGYPSEPTIRRGFDEPMVDAQIEDPIGVVMDRIDDLAKENDVDLGNWISGRNVDLVRSTIFQAQSVREEHINRARRAEDLEQRIRRYLHEVASVGEPQPKESPF